MSNWLWLVATALLALASSARAGTLYVATNGIDGAGCGVKTSPCRSITLAIANAAVGDKIIVGPGRYGPDVETGSPGCGCMLSLNKAVHLESSRGAAQTVIDGLLSGQNTTVLVITDGGSFGKPGKGFLVTQTGSGPRNGMGIDANNVAIRGNQFIPVGGTPAGTGVGMVNSPGSVLLEGNQVTGWDNGIVMQGANKTVRKNVVTYNAFGIQTSADSTVQGNVVIRSRAWGILLPAGAAIVSGNAVIANGLEGGGMSGGITNLNGLPGSGASFSGTISKNNIFGNQCGVTNDGVVGLVANDNYWGAATGPGSDPADDVCNSSGGTTSVTTFATAPVRVKPSIKP